MASPVCRLAAAAFAVSVTLALGFMRDRSSFAQPAPPCAPTEIGDVRGFNGIASFDIIACAAGDVLISQGKGLPQLQRLTTNVRQGYLDIFAIRPCDLVQGSDLPGAPLTVALLSSNKAANASRNFALARDNEKPTLTTTSKPDKGSKVAPKQKITVRMHADERYGERRFGWQGGVKKILLRDESRRQDVSPHWEAPGGPLPCDGKQWEQTLEVTFDVPSDPPPVIRLRACAWDHANNQDCDIAEFPTGDWYGRLEWSMRVQTPGGSWTRFFGTAALSLNSEAKDRLVGTILGNVSTEGEDRETGLCPVVKTVTPTRGKARLVGKHTPGSNVMSLATEQVEALAAGQLTPCLGAAPPAPAAEFAVMLHADTLQRQADGSFRAAATTSTVKGGSAVTNQFSLTLSRAGN